MAVLEPAIRALADRLVRLYYPAIAVEGAERVPATGPVVFVLNHPNGLIDPLLLRIATGRPARFLAKSTLFGNPLGRLAMRAYGALPVWRAHESGGDRGFRNEETFARCRAALAEGEALALFPEGASHSDPQMKPLKTGAARIVLSAEQEHAAKTGRPLGACVVPVGLYYERKAIFRSRVLLVVGEPLAAESRREAYARDERATVETFTDDVRAALDAVVVQAESRELLEGVARVASWTADAPEAARDLAARHRRTRRLLEGYERLRARDPARLEEIVKSARAFGRMLRRYGVRNPWALETVRVSPARVLATLVGLVVAVPVAAVGAALGYLPYRLAGEVARRMVREEDVLGTVKLIAGAVFLTLGWTAAGLFAGARAGAAVGLAVALAGPVTGFVALRFGEIARDAIGMARLLWLRGARFAEVRSLADRRRAIAAAVAEALEDSGRLHREEASEAQP